VPAAAAVAAVVGPTAPGGGASGERPSSPEKLQKSSRCPPRIGFACSLRGAVTYSADNQENLYPTGSPTGRLCRSVVEWPQVAERLPRIPLGERGVATSTLIASVTDP
jgi:hypothetical protein